MREDQRRNWTCGDNTTVPIALHLLVPMCWRKPLSPTHRVQLVSPEQINKDSRRDDPRVELRLGRTISTHRLPALAHVRQRYADEAVDPASTTAANGAANNASFPAAVKFKNGIAYCVTTGIGDADATAPPANTFLMNLDYN